jgi:cbb3-type cytochrome oxidase maturation protein
MKIIAVLIAISLVLALGFLYAFYKAVKTGQFDDLESPSIKLLNENKTTQKPLNHK